MVFTAMHLCNDHCQPKPVSAADSLASDGGSVGNLSLPPKDHLPCVRMLRRPQREGHGQANGLQVNAQEIMPTSHCAILRASPMLQAPSPFTSHASGWVSWLHWRTPTSNWATTRVPDVDDPVPVHVAAWGSSDRGGRRAAERRGGRRGDGRADRGVGRVGVVEVEAAVL